MKVRNTHCIELVMTPAELAEALGHPGADISEAEVQAKDGRVQSVRVQIEYLIATRGIARPKREISMSAKRDDPWWME